MKPLLVDIGNAYIQTELEQDVYVRGVQGRPLPQGKCLKLIRSVYGMPQSGQNWNIDITSFFIEYGMMQVREDLCLFALIVEGEIVVISSLYVDDIPSGFKTDDHEKAFIAALSARYDVTIIGLPSTLLGITLDWTKKNPADAHYDSVKLSIPKSIRNLLTDLKYEHAKPRELPYEIGQTLSKTQCPTEAEITPQILAMQRRYRLVVGTYIWINGTVRPEIGWIVLILCSFM